MHDIYKRGRHSACSGINLSYCIFSCVYYIKVIIKIKELLNMLLKQMFCKHEWVMLKHGWTTYDLKYGCIKCGRVVEKGNVPEIAKWKFKRQVKGDTFID